MPIFWPGEFHGLYSPWGCKECNMTERLSHTLVEKLSSELDSNSYLCPQMRNGILVKSVCASVSILIK